MKVKKKEKEKKRKNHNKKKKDIYLCTTVVEITLVVVEVVCWKNNEQGCKKCVFSTTNNVSNVPIMYGMLDEVYKFLLELHISSSQKHICPLPELSIMHT